MGLQDPDSKMGQRQDRLQASLQNALRVGKSRRFLAPKRSWKYRNLIATVGFLQVGPIVSIWFENFPFEKRYLQCFEVTVFVDDTVAGVERVEKEAIGLKCRVE